MECDLALRKSLLGQEIHLAGLLELATLVMRRKARLLLPDAQMDFPSLAMAQALLQLAEKMDLERAQRLSPAHLEKGCCCRNDDRRKLQRMDQRSSRSLEHWARTPHLYHRGTRTRSLSEEVFRRDGRFRLEAMVFQVPPDR